MGGNGAAGPDGPAPEWAIHVQPCGALLVDRRSLFYVRLSGRAAELALEIARTGSVAGAARVESSLTGRPPDEVLASLRRDLGAHPLTNAWTQGLLGDSVRVTGSREAFLPLIASLQLTNACNLFCSFCYASSGRPFANELAAAQWIDVLERLATHGVAAVTLTGGEPTIARDFTRILAVAGSLMTTVDVFTNGLTWRERDVQLASALGNVRCQVSIDGAAAHHDELRGREGSYARALATIRRLTDAGIPVLISMTVTPLNWRDVATVIDQTAEAGAIFFRAGRTVSVGRADGGSFGLTEEQIEAVTRQLDAAQESGTMEVVPWDTCADDGLGLSSGLALDFCTPAFLSWHVRPDGGVTPCQIDPAPFGHVLDEPLSAIGSPERMHRVRTVKRTCRCIRSVELPEDRDLPFAG